MKFILLILLVASPVLFAQTCNDRIHLSAPSERFIVSGDEVRDKFTGLIWQLCPLGQAGSDCAQGSENNYSWQDALLVANQVAQSTGKSWRLPNIKELRSLIEISCYAPSINLDVFPSTSASAFWTSSANASYSDYAWHVYFNYGTSGNNYKHNTIAMRLVRVGQ